jgi:DNA-binding transcriptional ArsR family regulator
MTAHARNKANFNELINKAADIFHGFSHPLRLSICLQLLEGKKSVNEICAKLDQPQHTVSQHLALLRKSQMVECVKESRQVFYWVEDKHVIKMLNCVNAGYEKFRANSSSENPDFDDKPTVEGPGIAKVFVSNVKRWSDR